MKKFLSSLIAAIFIFSLSTVALAAPGSFIQSPSRNEGPVLVEGENESSECTAELVVTPYKDRKTLPEKALRDIEKAYDIIAACKDLTTLNTEFASFVANKGLKAVNLGVSDLFDVSYYNCDIHDFHGVFRIKLSSDTLKNFVGLLHYKDGEWEFISNARVLEDGETLEFSIKDLSPFAIVVEKEAGIVDFPATGDNLNLVLPIIMFVCSAALLVVCIKIKKRSV